MLVIDDGHMLLGSLSLSCPFACLFARCPLDTRNGTYETVNILYERWVDLKQSNKHGFVNYFE